MNLTFTLQTFIHNNNHKKRTRILGTSLSKFSTFYVFWVILHGVARQNRFFLELTFTFWLSLSLSLSLFFSFFFFQISVSNSRPTYLLLLCFFDFTYMNHTGVARQNRFFRATTHLFLIHFSSICFAFCTRFSPFIHLTILYPLIISTHSQLNDNSFIHTQ